MKYTIYFMFSGLVGKRFVPRCYNEFSKMFSENRENGLTYIL